MKEIKLYNLAKETVGSCSVPDKLVDTPLKEALIKEAVDAHLASKRQGTRATKTTSTVSGSTRKLFRQKGTGNARAGSRKSNIRRHGATQFGPQPQTFYKKVNKKAKNAAMLSALAESIRQDKTAVIDKIELTQAKSKEIKQLLQKWAIKSLYIVETEEDNNFKLAIKNFRNLKITSPHAMNVYDILKHEHLWISKQAMNDITKNIENE